MDRLQNELQEAVQQMVKSAPLSQYVEVITDGLYDTLCANVGANPERTVKDATEYTLTEGSIRDVFRSTQLILHLAKIYEASEVIERHNNHNKLTKSNE